MFAWLRHNCSPLPLYATIFSLNSSDVLYHDNRRRQARRNQRRPGKKESSLTTIPEAETLVESVWLAGGKSKFIILLWGFNHCGAPLEREINKEKSATIFPPLSLSSILLSSSLLEKRSSCKRKIDENFRSYLELVSDWLEAGRLLLWWKWLAVVVHLSTVRKLRFFLEIQQASSDTLFSLGRPSAKEKLYDFELNCCCCMYRKSPKLCDVLNSQVSCDPRW